MKKQITVIAAAAFLLSACGENNELNETESNNLYPENNNENIQDTKDNEPDAEPDQEEPVHTDDPLGAVEAHLEGEGFDIGEHTEKEHEMIGAENGYGIEVNGEEVELYLYDPEAPELQEIDETGEYDMDGLVFEAESNGEIVLVAHGDHSDKEALLEAFHSFE